MPNGRRTTQRVGAVTIKSGQAAMLDPLAFGDLLGIDHETTRRALDELVRNGNAFRWHALNGAHQVLRHDLDDGRTSYELHP